MIALYDFRIWRQLFPERRPESGLFVRVSQSTGNRRLLATGQYKIIWRPYSPCFHFCPIVFDLKIS